MKKGMIYPKSQIIVTATAEGKSIEEEIRKMIQNKEPIQATAKINYTERKEGVLPQYNIRYDKFNGAVDASGKVYSDAFVARTNEDKGLKFENGQWIDPNKPAGEA